MGVELTTTNRRERSTAGQGSEIGRRRDWNFTQHSGALHSVWPRMQEKVPEVSQRLLERFRAAYPNLTIDVTWHPSHAKANRTGTWQATVQTSDGKSVALGVRQDPEQAIAAALEGIPGRLQG